MNYVFDSDVLVNLFRNYYRSRFPSFWRNFDDYITSGRITSVREVYNEIKDGDDQLAAWAKENRDIFADPTVEELAFVARIFQVRHFQAMVRQQERLKGSPVADPFVIARAQVHQACVVTQETLRSNAARIPNVCEHFDVACLNLEGFMEREDWTF